MTISITQQRLLGTKTFTIEYNGINVKEKGLTKQLDYFIDFESIPSSRFQITQYEKIGIMVACVCAIASISMGIGMVNAQAVTVQGVLFILSFTAIPVGVTYITRKEYTGFGFPFSSIILQANKPSRAEVSNFLSTLQQAKSHYLRDVYLQRTLPSNTTEALRLLLSLKDHGAISMDEFQTTRKELIQVQEQGEIGFGVKKA